jgi:hypothetical protein
VGFRATAATFGAEITRLSGAVVHRGDVDAIVPGNQIVQPRREDGEIRAQDRQSHGYAFVWSVVYIHSNQAGPFVDSQCVTDDNRVVPCLQVSMIQVRNVTRASESPETYMVGRWTY